MTDELWNEIQEDIKNIDIYINMEINGNDYHQLYCKYNYLNPAMASDSVATNFEQIFETYSPKTVMRVL